MSKKNVFTKLLQQISYQKQEKHQEFFIPEIKEQETLSDEIAIETQKQPKSKKEITPIADRKRKDEQPKVEAKQSVKKADKVFKQLKQNEEAFKQFFNAPINKDVFFREFTTAANQQALIIFLDGMASREVINDFILRPLLDHSRKEALEKGDFESVLLTNQLVKVETFDEVIKSILRGDSALIIEGLAYIYISETKGFDKRSVEKPQVEAIVMGAQEAFNENLKTNVVLIRRIIKNNHLTTEFLDYGTMNSGMCAVMYVDGLINPAIVDEVKRRINSLKVDHVDGSGFLEQMIEDNAMSIVPSVISTERPDKAAAHLMDGKVVIIAEGTPLALIVPITFYSLFQSPEDISLRWQYATLIRLVRMVAFYIALLLPSIYIAFTTFHQEMIPSDLLIAIAQAREKVPFPTFVEVLTMLLAFELIREAGIRVPGIIGNTIGIIGALILGQAAVQANLVSPILIIVVAVTGLGNLSIADYKMGFAARILSFGFVVVSSILGIYGLTLGFVALMSYLFSIKSFGVPFFAGRYPKTAKGADMLIRYPAWQQEKRSDALNPIVRRRQPDIAREWATSDANTKPTEDKKDE
ncbi:MAG: spore germination protein [Hyphomonadaceae bacterium]|nr:spore germination protein [Clostridia bacterium]